MLIVRDLAETRQMLADLAASLRQAVTAEPAGLATPTGSARLVGLPDALGLILAGDIRSPNDVPAFNRSQVDGYAVQAADTFGASEALPAVLQYAGEVKMGSPAERPLVRGTCQAVPTGGQIPAGADAMIMLEDVDDFGDGCRYLNRAVSPGSQIIFRGDDIRQGDLLLPAGTLLGPQHLAAAAASGLDRLSVRRPLRAAILSTGDELAAPGQVLAPGQIHDVNQVMLAALIRQTGATACLYGIIPDDFDQIQTVLRQAVLTCDIVVISGGSSVGLRDHVAAAIDAAGQPGILQHGIAVKPGKPTIIGLCGSTPVFGLPGHPAAAWFIADQLLRPLLFWLQGFPEPDPKTLPARLSQRIPSNHGREEFVLVQLVPEQNAAGTPTAGPLFTKSGLITVLSRCSGYIRIPRDCEGLEEGSLVTVFLTSPMPKEGGCQAAWPI